MDAKIIGQRIRTLREERGQTKTFLARQLGVSYSLVCQWEYGLRVPGDELKMKIARFFGCSVENLFFADEYHEK